MSTFFPWPVFWYLITGGDTSQFSPLAERPTPDQLLGRVDFAHAHLLPDANGIRYYV